jgi:hypothetical protein
MRDRDTPASEHIPPPNPTLECHPPVPPGAHARSVAADVVGRAAGEVSAAAATIPMLLANPVTGVDRIANANGRARQLWQALLINVIAWLVVTTTIVIKIPGSMGFVDRTLDLLRLTALLVIPFVALAASSVLARRIATPSTRHTSGYDALGAASALLPVQAASLVMVLFGAGGWTIWILACALLLAALIVQAVHVQNANGAGVTRMIFITPLQLSAAILLTIELMNKFLPQLRWYQ